MSNQQSFRMSTEPRSANAHLMPSSVSSHSAGTSRSIPSSGNKVSPDTLPTAKSLYSVDPSSGRHDRGAGDRSHAARHASRPASAAAIPGRHSAARAARRSGFNPEGQAPTKGSTKPFPSALSSAKHTSHPATAGHAKSQSLSTPRIDGEGERGAHSARSTSDAAQDPKLMMESKSYVSRETTAASSSSSRVMRDGSVVRTHARTLSGSLRSYAASWIPPQLQAAATTAGRMTPTAGLRIPGLPSLSRRTSPDRSAASSPDKESEDEIPALRRSRSAMDNLSYAQAPRSTAVHNRSVYHRAHHSYSHTHSQGHGITGSDQRTHAGMYENHVYGTPPIPGLAFPTRPASSQLVRTRGSAMAPLQDEPVPVPALDLRRLDQAVSLAVDAAKAADENEARRQSRIRARSRQGHVPHPSPLATAGNDTFPSSQSVPGYLSEDGLGLSLSDMPNNGLHMSSGDAPPVFDDDAPAALGSSLESDASIGTGPAANVRSRIGRFLSLPRSSAAGAAMLLRNYAYGPTAPSEEELAAREEAERRQDAELSLDLYISSLGYLLSALPPKEAMGVSEKHRAEMKATLLDALRKLESSAPASSGVIASGLSEPLEGTPKLSTEAASMQAELAALRNDLQAALATISPSNAVAPSSSATGPMVGGTPQVVHHIHTHAVAPGMYPALGPLPGQVGSQHSLPVNCIEDLPTDGQTSPMPASPPPASWRRRAVSSVTWGAVDLGLALSAGAVHLTARAVSWAIPTTLERSKSPNPAEPVPAESGPTSKSKSNSPSGPTNEERLPAPSPSRAQQDQTRSQWDLAIQLASSAVQTLSASVGQAGRTQAPAPVSTATEQDPANVLVRRAVSEPNSPRQELEAEEAVPAPALRAWPLSAAASGASSVREWVVGRAQSLSRVDGSPLADAALEEQVIRVAAELGRAVKRSPLPAQVGLLLSRLGGLLQALDARFMLRDKSTKLALKNVAAALRLARSYQLHIFAARAAVASVEAVVAAVEAYRDERAPSAPPPPALATLRAAALLLAQPVARQAPTAPASFASTPVSTARVG